MTEETKKRIKKYQRLLPSMKEKVTATFVMLMVAMLTAVTASYAWVALSRAPEVQNISTTLASNGALEIALAPEDGSMPTEFDIDETVGISRDILVTNLTWGNLVNLSDARYGIDNLALRPAQLNTSALLTKPLWGAVYGQDGRITKLNTDFAFARFDGTDFLTSNNTYGVRAIASYIATVSDTTQAAANEKIQAITDARSAVNQTYSQVPGKFGAMGTMISKYAQDKLDDTNTNLAPYIQNMIPLYEAMKAAMDKQMDAYVALANFQNHVYCQNTGAPYSDATWDQIKANKTAYNSTYNTSTGEFSKSSNGVVSLVGLTQFISDYDKLVADLGYLNEYNNNYKNNGTAYYWGSGGVSGHQLNNIVANLIDYNTMTIDLKGDGKEVAVTALSGDNASDLMAANGQSRNVFTYNGIAIRFEQLAIDESYRLNGKAACTIKVTKILTITVNGKAYTKASGPATFAKAVGAATTDLTLAANDSVAEDTYGLAIDLWLRCNAEQTCLTLEGAIATDEQGNIYSYDGVNRIWGSTGEATLTTDSTTQGGGSCYIYYADTPEDQQRSLDLLEAMKVAFVDSTGNLLASASMDTVNYYAVNGRITVPLYIDDDATTTYTFLDALNQEMTGRAITTLYLDHPQRIMAIVYVDGVKLGNNNVLAAAQIQGQLNLQFGSSETIQTIGDNDLIDDVREATATLSKYEMDYDNAVTADDLTTDITVRVNGTQPNAVTAFFLRAITPTQGSREETITFTRQEDGSWTGSYHFNAPGTYYLRYVRFDGVEYALHEPQMVEISGFGLHSVTWGEPSDEVSVRTSEDSYSVPISVNFASSDPSRMPQKVTARFVRSDGNQVNVPLSYSSATGAWTGTAHFTVSNTYTLRFLLFDDKYKALDELGMSKTITLALGLQVSVSNGSGSLRQDWEAGDTYARDLSLQILDNSGNAIEGIEGARLYYSNGGSATGTVSTNLTWNEAEGRYYGELCFTRPGRYRFSHVEIGGSTLTRCSESPVYAIISPNPPTFNSAASVGSFYGNGSGIQFAPYTYDAVMDNIVIDYGEAAAITAVVYNASKQVGSGNNLKQPGYAELSSDGGEVYFTGESWCVRLPTYTTDLDAEGHPLENASYTQEGTWKLCALLVSDCYDAGGNYRDAEHPIVWSGNDTDSANYISEKELTRDATYDFGTLRTTVSCTFKATFVPGTTALGSSSDAFMSRYPVSGTGMYVLLTDDADNVIPKNKIGDVTLNVSYAPPNSSNSYGYKVQSGAAKNYVIHLNAQDAENGHRTVSEVNGANDFDWQYVGPYNVTNLVVTLGSNTLTYTAANNIGLPNQYTVTTSGPAAENITLLDENITQRYTTLGKTGSTVTGTFLQPQDPGVSAKVTLSTTDNSDTQFVVLDGVTMQLVMNYKDGKTAPNGGYSWTSTSDYESVTINMSNTSGTYSTVATPLLSGAYATQLKVTVGGATTTKNLSDVSVYSKTPTVKIASVSPGVTTNISMNPDLTSEGNYIWNNVKDGLITVQNYKSDFTANVYAGVYATAPTDSEGTAIAGADDLTTYSLPEVTLSVTNFGSSFDSATARIGNATDSSRSNTFTFLSGGTTSGSEKVGALGSGSYQIANGEEGCDAGNLTVNYDIYKPAGEQSFNTLSAVKGSTTYTVQLTDTVTIREINTAPPRIQFAESPSGFTTPVGQESSDGGSFSFTLPASIGQQSDTVSVPIEGAEWQVTGTPATQKLCYVDYPNEPTLKESGQRGSCSSKYNYWIYEMNYTYYKFTKTTTHYTLTTGTNNYSIKKGVTKWIVGGVEYNPGQTITVNSVVTATPVIGELAGTRTFLNSTTQTGMKDRIQIVSDGSEVKPVTADSDNYSKNQNNTKAAVQNKEDANKPSGYEWGNASNKKEVITTQDYYTDPVWS